jgi:hypothetical protein
MTVTSFPNQGSKAIPLQDAQSGQSVLNRLPFSLAVGAVRQSLKAIKDGRFCRCHPPHELFRV